MMLSALVLKSASAPAPSKFRRILALPISCLSWMPSLSLSSQTQSPILPSICGSWLKPKSASCFCSPALRVWLLLPLVWISPVRMALLLSGLIWRLNSPAGRFSNKYLPLLSVSVLKMMLSALLVMSLSNPAQVSCMGTALKPVSVLSWMPS